MPKAASSNNAYSVVIGRLPFRISLNTVYDTMAEGQGASMALPIYALYLQKIFADPDLGYSEDEQFDVPDWFNPYEGCK